MLTGSKVRLRAYCREDTELAVKYINNPEVQRMINFNVPYPYTAWDEEKWVESQSALKETYNFAIETLEEKRYIGGCGINDLDWKNRIAEVGIMIGDADYWGRGYGTDAMHVLLRFAFQQMNLNKVRLGVFSYNTRAIRSYQKCGFVEEGRLRQEIFRDGVYHDKLIMGILREEYKP